MSQTAILGRSLTLRGGVSLYLAVERGWLQEAGADLEDTLRLAVDDVDDDRLTLRLYLDETESDARGSFDISLVDIHTAVQWALPADLRREFGIDDEFSYTAEFCGDVVTYEIRAPGRQQRTALA